ncbi:MAG: hypothetical protein HKP53_11405 [Eudoraea sp.]|nr:hypothetical protein [Eudoraea sp.]
MEITGDYKKDFWYIKATGRFDIADIAGIFQVISESKQPKVLIDCLQLKETNISYKDRYNLVLLAEELLNKEISYVVIWPKKDINFFWVNNASKFGLRVNIFPKVSAGKKWLLKD